MTTMLGPRLRVLLVTARYFPFTGGIETHVYEVARRLSDAGVDVTVLTTDPGGRLKSDELIFGVRVVRARAWPDVEDFYFAPGIYGYVRKGGWDVVHVEGSHTFAPPLAMLAARHARLPYVVTFHTGAHSSKLRNAGRGIQWMLLRGLFAKADRLVAVSRFEEEFFRERVHLPAERFIYIPNGSDLPEPYPDVSSSTDGPLILSIGRLEQYKGHHRVIRALPKLLERRPDARLCILGSGPYEHALRQLAGQLGVADRVEIRTIAAEDRRGMATALARANLVVLMSQGESHPVAVMEALALRRPVLGAHTPGLIELAERGLVRSIPVDSPPGVVAAAMLEQLEHPLIPGPGRLPTWDECASALLRVYQRIARRSVCAS
ncbi:MAG: glycosyltransferase family 4 protein [Chloroflexota bacterium]|nr:glycosyltransferase family 4 protein [Chloroflexota bacterium]